MDIVKTERLVILGPILFLNYFVLGYVLHGVIFTFKSLELSQMIVCVTISVLVFFGELVLLLLPAKVLVDHKLAPELKKDRDIIRLSFDEQDREIFRRIKIASNSFILMLTGLVNYFLIALFLFMWYSNNGRPLPPFTVLNAVVPVYGFLAFMNFVAMAYDILKR